MQKFIALLWLTCISATAVSQSFRISGQIRAEKEVQGAVISLLRAKDSSLIKSGFPEADGRFEFAPLTEGEYRILVSHIGFEKFYSSSFLLSAGRPAIELDPIVLIPVSSNLNAVTVTARKFFVERKADRIVVNPDLMISSAGATALEVLERAPGVLVDLNGNISLKGKPGVVVFVDDKPTYLAAADLAAYLRSLPASTVESIEIMTNPPARYDAAGNAGVINIRLKKNRTMGWNGGINLSYGQGFYYRTNNSANLNYRINKVNLFTNLSFNNNNTYQDLTINRYYYTPSGVYNSGFTQNSYLKRQLKSRTARIGADFYLNTKNTIGVVFSGFYNPTFVPVQNKAKVLDANDQPVNLIFATNPTERKWRNGSVNLNYNGKLNKRGAELTANIDLIKYRSTVSQELVNEVYTPDTALITTSTLRSSLPADLLIRTGSVDFSTPLRAGEKLDLGLKASWVKTDNIADFFDVVNSVPSPNYDFSNRFKYNENINALYLNYAREGKFISVQAGLRLENTNIRGNQLGNPQQPDSSFNRAYTSLFPTFYLTYKLDTLSKHQMIFSFGRRIDRPSYQDLNPFTYPLDRYTFYGGNPFLQPTFSYNFELAHVYKNFLTTTVEFSIVKNLIQESNEQRGTIYYSRPNNFGQQISYGISVNGNFQLTKWWMLQLYTEAKYMSYESDVYGQVLDEGRWYAFIGPTNQFTITKTLTAELAAIYQTRVLVAQFLTIPVWTMRVGFSQKILKGKGTLRLAVTDLFYTQQPGGDIRNIANSKANWLSYLDSRVATFSFAWRFNKGKSLQARQSGASETEKSRVKTN